MARTLDNITRIRLIEFVGKCFLETGLSAREIEQRMLESKQFIIVPSHVTISKYIQDYKLLHSEYADIIDSLVEDQKGSLLDNPQIVKRVNNVANEILSGKTIQEIALGYNVSYWVIYRDIHLRLKKLNPSLYGDVCNKLKENSKVK